MLRNYWTASVVVVSAVGAMLAVGLAVGLRGRPAVATDVAPRGSRANPFNGPEELYQHLLQTEGVERAEEWRRRQFDLGRPGRRQQAEADVEKIRRSDAADLINDMALSGGNLFSAGEFHRLGGVNWVVGCLRDRRFSRLYELVGALPADQARKTCERLFQQALTGYDDAWADGRKERPAGTFPTLLPDHAVFAVRSVVVLSALYCDTDTVLGQLAAWKAGNLKYKAAALLQDHPLDRVKWIEEHDDPDDLFTIHVFMLLLDREGKLTPEVLAEARNRGLPEEQRVELASWSTPADAGFLNQAEKQQYIVRTFPLTYDWLGGSVNFPVEVQGVKSYFRGLLKPGESAPADPEPTPAAPQ